VLSAYNLDFISQFQPIDVRVSMYVCCNSSADELQSVHKTNRSGGSVVRLGRGVQG
jgi:hypothetical protein